MKIIFTIILIWIQIFESISILRFNRQLEKQTNVPNIERVEINLLKQSLNKNNNNVIYEYTNHLSSLIITKTRLYSPQLDDSFISSTFLMKTNNNNKKQVQIILNKAPQQDSRQKFCSNLKFCSNELSQQSQKSCYLTLNLFFYLTPAAAVESTDNYNYHPLLLFQSIKIIKLNILISDEQLQTDHLIFDNRNYSFNLIKSQSSQLIPIGAVKAFHQNIQNNDLNNNIQYKSQSAQTYFYINETTGQIYGNYDKLWSLNNNNQNTFNFKVEATSQCGSIQLKQSVDIEIKLIDDITPQNRPLLFSERRDYSDWGVDKINIIPLVETVQIKGEISFLNKFVSRFRFLILFLNIDPTHSRQLHTQECLNLKESILSRNNKAKIAMTQIIIESSLNLKLKMSFQNDTSPFNGFIEIVNLSDNIFVIYLNNNNFTNSIDRLFLSNIYNLKLKLSKNNHKFVHLNLCLSVDADSIELNDDSLKLQRSLSKTQFNEPLIHSNNNSDLLLTVNSIIPSNTIKATEFGFYLFNTEDDLISLTKISPSAITVSIEKDKKETLLQPGHTQTLQHQYIIVALELENEINLNEQRSLKQLISTVNETQKFAKYTLKLIVNTPLNDNSTFIHNDASLSRSSNETFFQITSKRLMDLETNSIIGYLPAIIENQIKPDDFNLNYDNTPETVRSWYELVENNECVEVNRFTGVLYKKRTNKTCSTLSLNVSLKTLQTTTLQMKQTFIQVEIDQKMKKEVNKFNLINGQAVDLFLSPPPPSPSSIEPPFFEFSVSFGINLASIISNDQKPTQIIRLFNLISKINQSSSSILTKQQTNTNDLLFPLDSKKNAVYLNISHLIEQKLQVDDNKCFSLLLNSHFYSYISSIRRELVSTSKISIKICFIKDETLSPNEYISVIPMSQAQFDNLLSGNFNKSNIGLSIIGVFVTMTILLIAFIVFLQIQRKKVVILSTPNKSSFITKSSISSLDKQSQHLRRSNEFESTIDYNESSPSLKIRSDPSNYNYTFRQLHSNHNLTVQTANFQQFEKSLIGNNRLLTDLSSIKIDTINISNGTTDDDQGIYCCVKMENPNPINYSFNSSNISSVSHSGAESTHNVFSSTSSGHSSNSQCVDASLTTTKSVVLNNDYTQTIDDNYHKINLSLFDLTPTPMRSTMQQHSIMPLDFGYDYTINSTNLVNNNILMSKWIQANLKQNHQNIKNHSNECII
jgi:limonene-1,2-epoxide hydrolase